MSIAATAMAAPQMTAYSDVELESGVTAPPGLWQILDAHDGLLKQLLDLVNRLKADAPAGFAFAHRVGPHLRHILEHYTALFAAIEEAKAEGAACVDYDARARNRLIESDPDAARAQIMSVQREILRGRTAFPQDLTTPLSTCLTSGPRGQVVVTVRTSLGRELLFLESHTVHHMALLAQVVCGLGVQMDPDFGKAPATIAYERKSAGAGS
jgi:hypothetical protein